MFQFYNAINICKRYNQIINDKFLIILSRLNVTLYVNNFLQNEKKFSSSTKYIKTEPLKRGVRCKSLHKQ